MKKIRICYNGIRRHGRLVVPAGSEVCTEVEKEQVIEGLKVRGLTIAFVQEI